MIPEKHEDHNLSDKSENSININPNTIKNNATSVQVTQEELAYLDDYRKKQSDELSNNTQKAIEIDPTEQQYDEDSKIDLSGLFNTSDRSANNEQEEKKKEQKKLLFKIGGGVLAVIAITVTLATLPKKAANNQVPKTTVNTTIPETKTTPDTKPATTEQTTAPVETESQMKPEMLEQKVSIEAMEAMTLDEFAKLPYADRAAYLYTVDSVIQVPDANEKFKPENIPGYYWQIIRQDSLGNKNTTRGAKMISALTYYTTNDDGTIAESYKACVNSILTTGGDGVPISDSYVYVSSGKPQTGKDRDGNTMDFTNITYQISDVSTVKPEGAISTAQVFNVMLKLQDGRTINTYPAGYIIDGTKSPDPTYPY